MDAADKRKIQIIKDKAEIQKWSRIKVKPRPKFYFFYSLVIICLAYIVDELATNINNLVQSDVMKYFLNDDYSLYTIIMTLCSGIAVLTFFFRALADRFGRKPFVFINLFGMAIGMLICFISPNPILYFVGVTISFFFTPCDIQVLYVIETSSEKRRALNLSITKAIGVLGVTLIPLLNNYVNINGWQTAFFIPSIIGFVVGTLALLFMKESEVFMDCRISMLEDRIRLNRSKKRLNKKKEQEFNGGIIPAIKHMFADKMFLWLFLAMLVFAVGSLGAANYSVILSNPSYSAFSDDPNSVTVLYPFACAIVILLNGIVSDLFGRRRAGIFDTISSILSIIFFIVGVRFGWKPHLVGFFLGSFIGGYLSGLDTMTVICSEKAPTNLRSSLMSVISVSISVGTFIATALALMFDNIFDNPDVGMICGILIPPFLCFALYVLLSKVPETKGTSFENMKEPAHINDEIIIKK